MKRTLIFVLISFMALSSVAQHKTEYNPATYLSDIERALARPTSFECLSADSQQFSGMDMDILAYLGEQDAFVVNLKDDDADLAPRFIGIKDKEKGYLKYLNVEEKRYCYSLDAVIEDLYGSLEDYIVTWPEDQRHLFYDDPQGLYTFPIALYATNVVGYESSADPANPVKFKAAVSYLRTTRPEWNDDTWSNDSTEIVNFSDLITTIHVEYIDEKARFEGQDANQFSNWVKERLTYPDAALEDAATGRVTVMFKIDIFGNLEEVKVLRGIHPALDSVAFNVVSSSPKWTPGKDIVGNPHLLVYTFPVIFTHEMMFEAFITKMYNEKLYEDYDFLQKHCSTELLKKLHDAYPYDSDGVEYATWLFRSGQQDSKPGSDGKTMLVEVNSDGDWYTYTALDMGWEFSKQIKLVHRDEKVIIEDISMEGVLTL